MLLKFTDVSSVPPSYKRLQNFATFSLSFQQILFKLYSYTRI